MGRRLSSQGQARRRSVRTTRPTWTITLDVKAGGATLPQHGPGLWRSGRVRPASASLSLWPRPMTAAAVGPTGPLRTRSLGTVSGRVRPGVHGRASWAPCAWEPSAAGGLGTDASCALATRPQGTARRARSALPSLGSEGAAGSAWRSRLSRRQKDPPQPTLAGCRRPPSPVFCEGP